MIDINNSKNKISIYKKNNFYDLNVEKYKYFNNELHILKNNNLSEELLKLKLDKKLELFENEYLCISIENNNKTIKFNVENNQIEKIIIDDKYLLNNCFIEYSDYAINEYLYDKKIRFNNIYNNFSLLDMAKEFTILELKTEQNNYINNFIAYDVVKNIMFNVCHCHNNIDWLKNKLVLFKNDYSKCFKNGYPEIYIDNLISVIDKYKEYNNLNNKVENKKEMVI